ncbi:hypothetical protein CKO11_04655 [Rhodobacter sp. TJ_12]|nr:hypothetical protein [Rhodobacter sp. TJ_12]
MAANLEASHRKAKQVWHFSLHAERARPATEAKKSGQARALHAPVSRAPSRPRAWRRLGVP